MGFFKSLLDALLGADTSKTVPPPTTPKPSVVPSSLAVPPYVSLPSLGSVSSSSMQIPPPVNELPVIMKKISVDISKLYPPFRKQLETAFESWAAHMNAYIFCGIRSFEEQLLLYKQGRILDNTGKWVIGAPSVVKTKAIPGLSYHNYGVAVDFAFDAHPEREGAISWTWDSKQPWGTLSQLGKSYGLESASDWPSFPEFGHFQNKYGTQVHHLYDIMTTANTPAQGLLDCWKVFDEYLTKGGK